MVNIASRNSITEKPIVSLRETPSFITTSSQFATDTLMSLFHRALLLITLIVVSVGSMWGAEVIIWEGSANTTGVISSSDINTKFPTIVSSTILRVYTTDKGVWVGDGYYNNVLNLTGSKITESGTTYYVDDHYEFVVESDFVEGAVANIQSRGLQVSNNTWGELVTKVTLETPVDNFQGSAKSTCDDTGTDIRKYLTTETQLALDVTKAIAKLPSGKQAKYARFYVLHNGVAENLKTNTTLLEISGVTPAAQLPSKGIYGNYLYNSGNDLDLSGISVKLNATAGEFPDYQVICLLSTDVAEAATGNVVTEEPDWDVVFTYSFRNQVATKNQVGNVAWDAVAMTATIPTTDIATDWGTSWANLAQEQKIEWYVTDGSDNVQPLAFGSARQNDTWTINLSSPFAVTSNVAVLTGQTTYSAAGFEDQWYTWGRPAIYAPANKSFADVQDYKIICKIADDTNPSANTNVIYTLSLTNVFAGQEKSTISKDVTQVKLSATTDISKDIAITLPSGTKYARFYVLDGDGDAVDATDAAHQLTVTDGQTYTDKTLGVYLYNASGISLSSITFSSTISDLDSYQVVMLTSTETAVLDGGAVKYEPDYESQTTFWFNYPATPWNPEANVEWNPQSMQVSAPDIETEKGAGYLEKYKSHYTLQWFVVDKNGVEQPMRQGTGRVNDYWSVSINGDPFVLANANKILTITNEPGLGVANWNKWTAPVFFAPKNMTMKEITDAGIKFVCKFYEDDETPFVDTQLGMTYTIFIDRTDKLGKLKDGGQRGGKTITEGLTSTTTNLTIDLTAATTAFETAIGSKATYARVFLTKNDGTMLDPTTTPELLTNVGGTPFTTPEYGYYFQNETSSGITLPSDASLTLPAGKFNYYYVVVAMSADTGETGHTGAFAPRRAPSIASIYEPDYDYIYTIKFAETSSFPGTLDIDYAHSKEVLVKDESVKTATLTLSDSKSKMLTEYLVPDWATLRSNFHIRWYVVKKNDEGDFEKIPNSELYLTAVNSGIGHNTETDQGLYWNSVGKFSLNTSPNEEQVLNVTFNRNPGGGAPELIGNWEDYKIIAVMTKDLTGQTVQEDKDAWDNVTARYLTKEPDKLDMIYRFSFFKETQFQFVHDTGAGTSVFMTNTDDGRMAATVQQYSWDNGTSTRQPETGDVRQWVHTMEYDLYVDPSSSTPVMLHLPFQNYTAAGNNLEPAAYIRWYDWTTDVNSNRLVKVGTELQDLTETNNGVNVSRGFFFLNNDVNGFQPTHDKVGVTFNPSGVDGLITIACDVSKYYDGIYSGSTGEYLMHEPTLSTRYIFNIRPASVIATDIKIGQQKFEAGGSDMFELAENNGRVCVSIKNTSSAFTVRSTLPTLDSYYFYNGSTLVNAKKIAWVPYYVDEDGVVWKYNGYYDGANGNRIKQFTVASMSGEYVPVGGGSAKTITVGSGARIHLVGFLYDEGGSISAPLVHYELNFLEAPAYDITALPLERTEAYLKEHMTLQDQIIFDDAPGAILGPTIDSQLSNHTNAPIDWNKAQYGFCYPDVRRIWTSNDNFSGISPIHGDYMLLRSMNLDGVSKSDDEYYYKYHWYVGSPTLYDYTKTMGGEYGTFLYVDASDESRTIARMSFNANLCAGSELCFTGVIANMTTGSTNPQVMTTVYAVNNIGKRTRVVSFHSTELSMATATGFANGTWYQIYGRIAIPATIDLSGVDHYEVDIDNYASNTDGADYCVDQLMFFTSNARLKVKQSGVNCGEESIPMNFYVRAEDIESMAGKNIFWRICDADGNALTDATLYDNGGKLYGQTTVSTTIPDPLTDEASLPNPYSGYFKGVDGVTYFSLANKGFKLKEGADYYISVYSMSETSVIYESLWGNPANTCSVFSPVFVPKKMYLTMKDGSDNLVTSVNGGCSDKKATVNLNVVLNMPDDDEVSGFKPYTEVKFDYFLGTLAAFNDYYIEVGSVKYYLSEALKNYRGKAGSQTTPPGTTYQSETSLNAAYESANANYYAVINKAITEGKLFLSVSSAFSHTIQGDADNKAYIAALPIDDTVTKGSYTYDICTPLEFVFNVITSGNAPSLTLGFDDVTYPAGVRVVRVGMEQLNNMQTNGYLLHIPVNTFKKNDTATAKNGTLKIQGDLELLAYSASADQTNDDQISANVDKVATFAETEITNSKMYVAVNFNGTGVTKPTFKEGFTYRMFFQFKDKDDATACDGNAEFLLKVVPEFVTWNGTTAEWNNDANWHRSARAELYKDENNSGKKQNTNTAGHPDGYDNNGEGSLTTVVTTPNTFVPMKFTYVTLPTGTRAPNLVNLTYDTEKIYNNIGATATTNIQYDLMVRYTEKTCQDHSISGDVYDCEKFYGNWAKELYMKPAAELVNQQYLTYEKVWVEKELTSNTWTLMSTPLQNTYAGDMYVPYSATADDNGRQLTEAFQPINFSTTADAAGFVYSRTKYPIYQKGWTQQGVYVYTKTNDVRATKYSANIPGGVSTILNQWSHSYNDVMVPYSTWTAFAIRPHKKAQTAKTLIRLPKADASYDYYQWDNTSPTDGKLTQNVAKSTTGKLLTDGTANISGVTYGTVYGTTARTAGDGSFNTLITNIQSSPANYQLVGNPYLCSIDMATFISGNSANLDVAGYWTYNDNNTGTPVTTGTIAPMQSFFVKAKSGATEIVFTPSMMKDGTSSSTPAPAMTDVPVLMLTAQNDRGTSKASVVMGEGQSVETLFDSNLEDVPMVYTVADGQAVSINHAAQLEAVSFGVTCKSEEAVDVAMTGLDTVGGSLYVFDAVDGTSTTVSEGSTISVMPNEYGRYFLTRSTSLGEVKEGLTDGIRVSVHGGEVNITASSDLGMVRAMSIGGATMYQATNCGTTTSFALQQGVYVIETDGAAGNKTMKIVVK